MTDYPVDYAKGDDVRQAKSRKDETKLKFDGFVRVTEATSPAADDVKSPSYTELQEQAKALQELGHTDLKATGTYDELLANVSNAQADQDELEELK